MRKNVYIEHSGQKIDTTDLLERVKDIWREQGNKLRDLQDVSVYYNLDQNTCYYVINEHEAQGNFNVL